MICLIAAFARNSVIGNNGHIPWKLPQDQQRFKKITLGNVVIMGRKTFEDIFEKLGHALPGRETIVISASRNFEGSDYRTVKSLQAALDYAENFFPDKDVYICGGESVYREALALNIVQKMYLSEIECEVEGDAFFPDFDKNDYEILEKKAEKEALPYIFVVYSKKNL